MKYRFFSLAAMALALTLSCAKEEPTDNPAGPAAGETDKPEVLPSLNEGEIAFRASGEFFYNEDSDDTDGVMSCFDDGTKASVFTIGNEAPMEVQAVNTVTNAYFVAAAESSKTYYAVYPSSVPHHFDSGEQGVSISVTIPQEQDGSLSGASISVASSTGKDARMDFRNICGLLKFSTTSQNIKSVTFRGADDENITGTVSVSGFDPETGEPIFGGISQTSKEAKLNVEGRKGVFYLALLPGLTLENGFLASFEMMPQAEELEEAMSAYSMTLTRSGCRDLGNILDYIPQLNWFVTQTGGAQIQDGKSWETAISGEQMFQMIACNRPEESGSGNLTTDITSDANKDNFADYLKVHNTKHVQQLDGVTFHIAQGEYSSKNYVRVSFPELERKVRFTLRGGYDPRSVGKDLTSRDIAQYPTVLKAPSGSGTARMLFLQRWLDMTIDGLTFTGGMGDASIGGGAVLLNESSTSSILFKDCTFTKNNSSSFGGAVTGANEVGQISFVGCVFSDNSAVKSGGAIRITGGTWNFTDCKFSGNKGTSTDSFGGVMYVKSASLTCTGCTFSENSSVNNGGAVWLNAMSKAEFTNCDFISNVCTANLAGAICLSGANPLNITGGTFKENSATEGGCIYNNAASNISITGTKFINNVASTGVGGVFYCKDNPNPEIIIENAEFTGNTATKEGGAIFFKNGKWTVTNTAFKNNTAESNGGAIYAHTGSLTIQEGSYFEANETKAGSVGGGAIYVTTNATISVAGSTFKANKANGSYKDASNNTVHRKGGAIAIASSAGAANVINSSTFVSNESGWGGGVFVSGKQLDMSDCSFKMNTTSNRGGAVYGEGANLRLRIDKTHFSANASVQGAAVRITNGVLYMNASTVTDNKPSNNNTGGVLYLEKTSFINNCCFYDNDNSAAEWVSDIVLNGAASTILNSTIIEKDSNVTGIRTYNTSESAVTNLYNNTILCGHENVGAGWGANWGSLTSCGYNYTGPWVVKYTGTTTGAVAKTVQSDNVVTPVDVFDNFTSASTTDGRGYYTWTKPADVNGTSAANVTAFLAGITGGSDFATWLGTVDGLTKDIAGNARPQTGWYPGCYQGN